MENIVRINELVGSKNFEKALQLLSVELENEPNNVELLKLAGLCEINLNLWSNAKARFETVVKFSHEDATSWFYLASCYEKLADFISSKNAYIKVIELRPEYAEAYQSLCIVLLKLDDIDGVIDYAKKALDLDSDSQIFEFILGTAYMKNKEFVEALDYLKKASENDPSNIPTLNSLGTCYMSLGKFSEAINTYKNVLMIDDKNSMAYYNIGSVYQIQGKHEEACEYFEKALLVEEEESYLVALAISLTKLGRYEDALKDYKQLALLCPTKETYQYNIVTCYEALGEYEIAISMLEKIVYVNPKFILPAQKLASLYIKTNQLTKAKNLYDSLILKNSVSAEVLHQYALLSSSLCDTETAEKILKKVISMNPEIARAHKDLGVIYLNKRLFDYAKEEFKLALELSPQDFEILFEYGNFLYSISDNVEAEIYYAKALDIEPENILALTFMALNKLVLNQKDEAYEYIMQAIKVEPHHEYVQYCAGRILYAKGDYDDAKMYLVKAVEQNPDIETQNTLALTYQALGEHQQAINIFKNILSKNSKSISVLMDIAKCYEALGENDNALEYLDKLVEIFPDNEMAHEMIRKLS